MSTANIAAAAVLACWSAMAGADTAEGNSLLNESTYHSLVAEHKAAVPGDVLTVIVQEAASATSSADLRAQRSFSVSGRAGANGETHSALAGTGSESDGEGRTQRSGRLLAQLSVRVTDVNGNGDLVVAGQQTLRINGEEQLITLSGVVRPRDINDANSVLSSRIAEARIEFSGKGFVASQSKPGWLARVFGWLGW